MDLISLEAAALTAIAVVSCALAQRTEQRRACLLAVNVLFLASFSAWAPLVCAGTSLVAWGAARLAARGARRGWVVLASAPLLAPLFLPKLPWFSGGGAEGEIGNVLGSRLALFVGASYYSLRALHFVIEARRRRALLLSFHDFLVWNSFFPTIVAGPIERADHFARSFARRADAGDVRAGLTRIFQGLLKKVVLGSLLIRWAQPISTFGAEGVPEPGVGQAWIALYAICLYAYVDFAGYSDLAIGAARLMGIRLAENFDNPYLRPSISEFWQGWHLSLSFWIRDYLFLPLCGRSRSALRPHAAALVSMGLCGLWHAPTAGWLLWGLLHGLGLSVHQGWTLWMRRHFALKKRLAASPLYRGVCVAATFHFVAFTWVWIAIDAERFGPALRYLSLLLGF
jgi:D-alanyl-lipoteichoic acid acyltransferase DltB (MBOAT superfamily)